MKIAFALVTLVTTLLSIAVPLSIAAQPNIVVILADDKYMSPTEIDGLLRENNPFTAEIGSIIDSENCDPIRPIPWN
jgi:hypothetical protein